MTQYRVLFELPCNECGELQGYSHLLTEQFCAGCGRLRNGVSRFLDLPPGATDSVRRVDWERQKYEQRLARESEMRDRLETIGAIELKQHPLGHKWCGHGCHGNHWLAVAVRTRNGTLVSRVHCGSCGRLTPMHSIGSKLLDPTELPVLEDRACTSCSGAGCAECSKRCAHFDCESYVQIEAHHIMPRHIAAAHGVRADHWPIVFLCREHHMQWHRLVTPNMSRRAGAA